MINISELRSMVNATQFESFANSVINSLLDRLEATEEDRACFLVEMGRLCAQRDALRLRIKAAEKERDTVRIARAALEESK